MAALLASAPVTGLVRSTPASLPPPAQAHSAARHSVLGILHVIVAFPLHSKRPGGRGRAVPLRDQRPQEAQLLPLRGGLPAAQAPLQRARGQLVLARAVRRLLPRRLGVRPGNSLGGELAGGEPRSVS